ncbi:MAG: pallilysin-related adhesin [Treponema sp.]|jgi:hypothetical protein|nr:pallilysin-related adhesin [Treponema sp.]
MEKSALLKIITPVIFVVTAAFIAVLYYAPSFFFPQEIKERKQTKMVIPQVAELEAESELSAAERMAADDNMTVKTTLLEGESLVAVLTQDLDGDQMDEQIIAYRNLLEIGSPISVAYIAFDERRGEYRRMWSGSTAAERPGMVNIYSQDLIGDRSICVIVGGMTGEGEHTLTVFRKNAVSENGALGSSLEQPLFAKIAEFTIDGSITVRERERSQAYQLGHTPGQSHTIVANSRDMESSNIMDRLEITYVFNPRTNHYEQAAINRMPGAEIEQQKVRELLSGKPGVFEKFIAGLWYHTGSQGTPDSRQYIYFDPANRELIFYSEEIQQIFQWQNSGVTRLGLYISSQNISVTTLKRFLDIELESPDSLRIRVFEDVRLKINVNDSWDGSYRKAGGVRNTETGGLVTPYLDAVYNGSIGKIQFFKDGVYELYTEGTTRRGSYAFFRIDDQELLELRPGAASGGTASGGGVSRETYLVGRKPGTLESVESPGGELTLLKVRLSTKGIEEAHEAAIFLALAES